MKILQDKIELILLNIGTKPAPPESKPYGSHGVHLREEGYSWAENPFSPERRPRLHLKLLEVRQWRRKNPGICMQSAI